MTNQCKECKEKDKIIANLERDIKTYEQLRKQEVPDQFEDDDAGDIFK